MALLDLDLVALGLERGFDALDEEECLNLLAEGGIGRVALTMGAIPVVLPVNYCFVAGAIAFLTGEGSKLRAAANNTVVAFQVDDIDSVTRTGWSVLAVGTARVVSAPSDLVWMRRLPLDPWAPGDKNHVVRVIPEFVSGRRITATLMRPDDRT